MLAKKISQVQRRKNELRPQNVHLIYLNQVQEKFSSEIDCSFMPQVLDKLSNKIVFEALKKILYIHA